MHIIWITNRLGKTNVNRKVFGIVVKHFLKVVCELASGQPSCKLYMAGFLNFG